MSNQEDGRSPSGRATAVEPVPVSPLRDGIPSAFSREAAREQKAIKVFLLVRSARALIRSQETPWWNPLDRVRSHWVAAACANAAHAIEQGDHHATQAEWLSPIEAAQGIEAGTAETDTGSVHESPVAEGHAPGGQP